MFQVITAADAAKLVSDNSRIMVSGFLGCGCPEGLVDALVKQGSSNLHLISICTDFADKGAGKLITSKQVKSVQTSHIGTNSSTQEQFNNGTIKVEFNPQGTLIERIRATGSGLGGILTAVGIGTILEEDKCRKKIKVNGKEYFLEMPIGADFAFIKAHKADKMGNLVYRKTARNINPIMGMAAKITIVEVDEIVETGDLDPETIITPGIFVDYIVKNNKEEKR